MRSLIYILFLALSSIVLISCTQADTAEISQKVDEIMKKGNAIEKIANLKNLDAESNSIKARINLTALYLQANLPAQSQKYMDLLKNQGPHLSNELKYIYYVNKAALHLVSSQPEAAIEAASAAIAINANDPNGAKFTLNKAIDLSGQKAKAESGFVELWKDRKNQFSFVDCVVFIELLTGSKNWHLAHEVADYVDSTFGFQPDMGFVRARILQEENDGTGTLSASMRDIDYRIAIGILTATEASTLIDEITTQLVRGTLDLSSKEEIQQLSNTFKKYVLGEFAMVSKELRSSKGFMTDKFRQYLALYSSILDQSADMRTLSEYVKLEKIANANPHYYFGLWFGMQHGKGSYNLATVGPVLEAIIVSNTTADTRENARKELAKLMEIPPNLAEKLLIPAEIDAASWRIIGNGELRLVDLLTDVLTTGSNFCADYSWKAITALAQVRAISEYLLSHYEAYPKEVKIRLRELGVNRS